MLFGSFQKTIPARFCVKQTSRVLPGKTGSTVELFKSLNLKESDQNIAIIILDTSNSYLFLGLSKLSWVYRCPVISIYEVVSIQVVLIQIEVDLMHI